MLKSALEPNMGPRYASVIQLIVTDYVDESVHYHASIHSINMALKILNGPMKMKEGANVFVTIDFLNMECVKYMEFGN